jgi:serine/threonine-protein kinase
LNEPPPDLGTVRDDVPPELVELVFELLAKDRVYRPSSAGEVANRLEAILADQVAEEGPLLLSDYMSEVFAEKRAEHRAKVAEATEAAIARRPESKRRGRAVVIAAAVGLAIVGAGGAFWLASASDDIAQERDAADAVEPVGAVAAAPPSPAPKSNQRQHTAPDSEPVGGTRADVPQQGPRGRRRENGRAANDATRASDGGSNRTSARPARRRRRPASRRARRDKDGIPMWSWE